MLNFYYSCQQDRDLGPREKNFFKHSKTNSTAYVMTHAYSEFDATATVQTILSKITANSKMSVCTLVKKFSFCSALTLWEFHNYCSRRILRMLSISTWRYLAGPPSVSAITTQQHLFVHTNRNNLITNSQTQTMIRWMDGWVGYWSRQRSQWPPLEGPAQEHAQLIQGASIHTVEPRVFTHTPGGWPRVWVLGVIHKRSQVWCKFPCGSRPNIWVMGI